MPWTLATRIAHANFWRNGARRIFANCHVVNWFVVSSSIRCCRRTATYSGFLAWYSVLAAFGLGPAGAVLYRSSEFVSRYWRYQGTVAQQPVSEAVQAAAAEAWRVIDWFPARITALGFAVVGSFEEAIDSWRNQVQRFPGDNDGVILAATAGAINVRLGDGVAKAPVTRGGPGQSDLDAGETADFISNQGREPEPAYLAQVVGLVWRSVVMWLVLLALLTLARLLG
jgi:adenosylcobinamide-phosphate synthase